MIKKLLLPACLILAATPVFSETPRKKSFPLLRLNTFVGHYGEFFEFHENLSVEAEVHDAIEVIRIHAKWKHENEVKVPYKPAASQYKPENFTPFDLMQIVVIPKSAPGGFNDLRAIRQAKEKEFSLGAQYKISQGSTWYQADSWPPESFEVKISTPYRLTQIYSQTPSHFFILSYGEGRSSHFNFEPISISLSSYLYRFYSNPSRQEELNDLLGEWRKPHSLKSWLFVNGLALILIALPGWHSKRFNVLGWSLFSFPNSGILFGWSIPHLFNRLHLNIWRNEVWLAMPLIILMPWLCRYLSDKLGGTRSKKVFWRILATSAVLLAASVNDYLFLPLPANQLAAESSFYLFLIGIIFGLCFGFTFSSKPDRTSHE